MDQIDKADIQKFVNVFSQRHSKLDYSEENLQNTLISFTEFFTKSDEIKTDEERPDKPYHFRLEHHVEFKRLSIPISRAMYSVPKVVMHMRTELYQFENSASSMLPEPVQPFNMNFNINQEQKKEKFQDKIMKPFKRDIRDPNSPHMQMQEFISKIQIMPSKWQNILHWYELGVRKRNRINTYNALQGLLDNIIIAFNVFIEPNLVWTVHYANEITKTETELTASKVLEAYLKVSQQNMNNNSIQPYN